MRGKEDLQQSSITEALWAIVGGHGHGQERTSKRTRMDKWDIMIKKVKLLHSRAQQEK